MSSIGAGVGGVVSGITGLISSANQNSAAAAQQQTAEQYNTAMADTTYQRTVTDLEDAGLNPMLAVGAQDASPTISQAPVVNTLGTAMNAGISNYSALQSSRQTDPQINNTQSSTNLNNFLAAKAAADTTSALANAAKTQSGSVMSDVVGSSAASKVSQYLNNAMSDVTAKISSLVNNITTNSASAGNRTPVGSFGPFSLSRTDAPPQSMSFSQ